LSYPPAGKRWSSNITFITVTTAKNSLIFFSQIFSPRYFFADNFYGIEFFPIEIPGGCQLGLSLGVLGLLLTASFEAPLLG
jgi:hypothetical protein